MKATKIYFQKNFSVGQFQNEHYGIEIELEQQDIVEDAFKEARNICFQQFKKDNPQITWNEQQQERDVSIMKTIRHLNNLNPSPQHYQPIEIPEPTIGKGTIEEQIEAFNGTEDEFKKDWYYIAGMNKKYKPLYEQKLKELQP